MTHLSHTRPASLTSRPRRPLVTMMKGLVAGVFLGGARCGGPGYDGAYDDDVDETALDGGDAGRRGADAAVVDAQTDAVTEADAESDAAVEEERP